MKTKLNRADEKIGELENNSIQNFQVKAAEEKRNRKVIKQNKSHLEFPGRGECTPRVSQEPGKEGGCMWEAIMTQNSKLIKDMKPHEESDPR